MLSPISELFENDTRTYSESNMPKHLPFALLVFLKTVVFIHFDNGYFYAGAGHYS
jgi:hypothetical protein